MSTRASASTADRLAYRIAAARLRGQFLVDTPAHKSAADVVRALVAVQSQDYEGGKWAIAIRAAGLTNASIDAAFDRGEILRTHVLRPTWHFVAPEDLRWLLALTGPRISAALSSYNRKLGLDDSVFRKSRRVIEKALTLGEHLTRAELKVHLDKAKVPTDGTQRLAHLVMQAELDAVICSGARKGKQSTYALVDDRVRKSRELSREESLRELAVRYFATHAPATVHDFAWWSGLTIGDSKRAVAIAEDELFMGEFDGKRYVVPAGFELPTRVPKTAHLLPNYDEFFIGFRDRSAIGHRLSSHELVTGGNALIAHVVTIDGQLVGGWKRREVKGNTVIDVQLLTALRPAERTRLHASVERLSRFLGSPVIVAGLPSSR